MNHKKKIALVASTVAAVLLGGGIAAAYWTTTGSGTGSANSATAAPTVTLTTVNPATGLYPGGPAQDVDFTITNPGVGSVHVSGVTFAVTGSTPAGCGAGNFTLTQPTSFAAQEVAGGATVTIDGGPSGSKAAIAMDNLSSNQDACKNVTVNLSFTSN